MKHTVLLFIAALSFILIGCRCKNAQHTISVEQSTSALALNLAVLKRLDQNDARGARFVLEHNVNHGILVLFQIKKENGLSELQAKALDQAIDYRKHHSFSRSEYRQEPIPSDEEVEKIVRESNQ